MVSYWRTKDGCEAKIVQHKDGHYMMYMEGEKYPFPGHPRGVILYGKLSPIKHWIKNKIFNNIWYSLEEGKTKEEIALDLQENSWPFIFLLTKDAEIEMVPYEQFQPSVKLLHNTLLESGLDRRIVEAITFILQEDDAYRMRFQWIAKFNPNTKKKFFHALDMLENAEMVSDMKERIRLLKRGLEFFYDEKFELFLKNMDWKKFRLSKADKYFFRGKYFKVDYPEYQY